MSSISEKKILLIFQANTVDLLERKKLLKKLLLHIFFLAHIL